MKVAVVIATQVVHEKRLDKHDELIRDVKSKI